VTGLAIGLLGLFGLLIGSFTNVVVARVPADKSVNYPPSACPKCDHRIRPYDNVPVVSWLLLGGKCRDCKEPISKRYPLVELGVAAGFAAVPALLPGTPWVWPAACWVVFLAVALSIIDVEHMRLPDSLTYPATPVLLALLAIPAFTSGNWVPWVTALLGGVAVGAAFLGMWLVYSKGMGLGDVKLAPMMGVALGWAGWAMVGFGSFAAFLVAGFVSTIVMIVAKAQGKNPRGIQVPFGPFFFVGIALAVLVGGPVLDWYTTFVIGA
jgi:leader peptidase (prepilin peptidase) / N-methyltransferase